MFKKLLPFTVVAVVIVVFALVGAKTHARDRAFEPVSVNAEARFVNPDSLIFVSARRDVDTIDGLLYSRITFNETKLFGGNQQLFMVEVPPTSPYDFSFSYEPRRTPTSTQARKASAVVAVNGSYFDMQQHNPICYLRINGVEYGVNTPGVDTLNRKYYQYATIVLRGGRPVLLTPDSARMWERGLADSNVMTAGPMLLTNGDEVPQRSDRTFVMQPHNRTALGLRANGTVVLLVVDGRQAQAVGMTLPQLCNVMRWLGCTDAINLDGGGSSTLYLKNFPYNGVVNYPTDNGRRDHLGERGVSNCVLLKKRSDVGIN